MDEQTIAQKLAQNIPQDQPQANVLPENISVELKTDTGYVDTMPFDELTKYKLCEHFQIPHHQQSSPETTEKISLVYAWAAQVAGSEDYLAIQTFLHGVDGMIGLGGTQTRLDKFYQYARLDLQRRRIEQEMRNAS